MRTMRSFLNTSEIRSVKTSSCGGSGLGKRDRADLAAGDRRLGQIFGETESSLDAAGLGTRDVTGDTVDLRIVVRVNDDLVIRPDELEDRVDLSDRLGLNQRRKRQQRKREELLHGGTLCSFGRGADASRDSGTEARRMTRRRDDRPRPSRDRRAPRSTASTHRGPGTQNSVLSMRDSPNRECVTSPKRDDLVATRRLTKAPPARDTRVRTVELRIP